MSDAPPTPPAGALPSSDSRFSILSSRFSPPSLLLLALLAASFAFHCVFIATTDLDLFPDEAQYWDWSRRPDLGYYSKPPLVAWTILASRTLLGADTPFAVRLPAVVLGTATTFFLFRFVSRAAGGAWAGLLAAAAYRLTPMGASESVAITTDSLLMLFWVLSAIFLFRATVEGDRTAWIGCGLSLGLGLLSKYSMLVFLIWAVAAVHLAGQRGRLAGHGRWMATGTCLAMLAFVPPLVWNARHGWASFRHVAAGAGKPGHLGASGLSTAAEFLGSQLLFVTPILFCTIVWAAARSGHGPAHPEPVEAHPEPVEAHPEPVEGCPPKTRPSEEPEEAADRFLFWGFAPMFAMYLATSFLGRAEANWPAAAYVAGLAAFARHVRRRPRLIAAALAAALPFVTLSYSFDLVYALGLNLKPKQDPTTRMRGWRELGAVVGAELAKLPQDSRPFVLGDSYQMTAALAFYVPGQPRVYCVELGRRRCQYDYWPGFESFLGCDAVYATEGDFPRPHHMLRRAFGSFERAAPVVYRRHGLPWRTFSVFVLRGFRGIERPGYEEY